MNEASVHMPEYEFLSENVRHMYCKSRRKQHVKVRNFIRITDAVQSRILHKMRRITNSQY